MTAFACTLSSGSDGNCLLVSDGGTALLIDAGISARRISGALRAFSLSPGDISAVLVTHEHGDHVCGLARFGRRAYASPATCRVLAAGLAEPVEPGAFFSVGTIGVTAFATPHDTPQSMGYLLEVGKKRVALCTDLGHMPDGILELLKTADVLFLEANHDVTMVRRGPYPVFLKDRILGRFGHLSNDACAAAATACALAGARHITLCHLSHENNSPDLALGTVAHALQSSGVSVGADVFLEVAPHGCSGVSVPL